MKQSEQPTGGDYLFSNNTQNSAEKDTSFKVIKINRNKIPVRQSVN